MNYSNQKTSIKIDISYNKKISNLDVNPLISIGSLKKIIFTYLEIDSLTYDLYYKNIKLTYEDKNPLFSILGLEKHPKFKVLTCTESSLKKSKDPTIVTIYTKIKDEKFQEILNNFYLSKNLETTAEFNIENPGIFSVKFDDEDLALDFKKFYAEATKGQTSDELINISMAEKNVVNLSKNKKDFHKLFKHLKEENKEGSGLTNNNNSMNIKINNMNKKMNKNFETKLPFIRDYGNENRMSRNHSSYFNNAVFESKKNSYMSPRERYLLENYIDKKNWICDKNFVASVGNYSLKKNYKEIGNYVGSSPSKPVANYNYREVYKKKWMDPSGFKK